jgi:PBSX family phage terminase large subunit
MPTLTKPQAEIAKDKHRFRVVCVGRRGGKTTLAVEEIKGVAIYKESRIAYIAPTYQQARDIAWQMLVKEFKKIAVKINESRLELEVKNTKNTTSLIQLRGWESIETLRGQSFDFLVIDEVASMRNFWINWQEVLRPTLTDRKGEALFISTPKGFNHFYDLYNTELKDKDFKSFHFTSYNNPYIPSEEIDLAKNQMTPDRFAQEYLADFKKTEGLVYKEFSREKHLYDILPQGVYQYITGIDFGYTNPAGVAHIYFNGEKYYLEDEWYKRERTETQIAEYVAQCKFEEAYPDPENPSAIEELRNRGINVREVAKGKDSVVSGIQKVRELLLNNKFLINRKCINTIYEFETYSYDDEKNDRENKEKPIASNNHLLDAIRYVVMMTWDIKQPNRHELYDLQKIRQERRNEFV